jgi:nucleoside-diphosphate-sugar epimerase
MQERSTTARFVMADAGGTILVTGARGFIGPYMVRQLLRTTRQTILAVDVKPVEPASDYPPQVVQLASNLADEVAVQRLFVDHRIVRIFDLASNAKTGGSAEDYHVNDCMTRHLCAMVKAHDIERLIFFSTCFVHRKANELPASDDDYSPLEAYGASKVDSERHIRTTVPADKWLVVRPTYVWGAGSHRFANGLLYRIAKGQMLLPSDHSIVRHYGHVSTVCGQAAELADADSGKTAGRVFYVSDPPLPLREFGDVAAHNIPGSKITHVPAHLIRALGALGGLAAGLGIAFPINPMQARELTTNFPLPLDRTLSLTHTRVDLEAAMAETTTWAREATAGWTGKAT